MWRAMTPFNAPQHNAMPSRRHWLYAVATNALCSNWIKQASASPSSASANAANSPSTALPLQVLLIGNSTYQRNAALTNPIRDTALLTQAFKARGAQVRTLGNLTARQLEAAVRQFLQAPAARSSALWLGYSGHAVQIGGRNYLQGIDSDFSTPQRVREFGVDLELLLGLIERARPPAAVVAVDACRNNPFEPERTRGLSIGLAAQEPHGVCLSFSTAPYTKALDGEEGQYSPYALALSQALGGQQGKSLDALLRETANSVYRSTNKRQIPEYRSALRSEWWFGSNGVSLVAAPAAAQYSINGSVSRSVSYRPDEPISINRYNQRDASSWTELDRQLQMDLNRMSDVQVRELLRNAAQGSSDENQRLLASMVWEDGHSSTHKQPATARQLLLPLASRGHVLAQTLLGESFYGGRIQTRSATPVDSVNEGGVLRAVDQQFSVHSQR